MPLTDRRGFFKASAAGGAVAMGVRPAAASYNGAKLHSAPLAEWIAEDPTLAPGELAIAALEGGTHLVKIGEGKVWSKTPALRDPLRFADLAALRRASWLRAGDMVDIDGRAEPGDGGGARWRIETEGPADDVCCIELEGGLFARLAYASRYDIRQAGIFADTDGAETAFAIETLTRHAIKGRGGVIEICQPIGSHNVVFPQIPQQASITYWMVPGASVTPTDPLPGVFMWDFPAGDWNTYPNFINVKVVGNKEKRPLCNGIRVAPTNGMTVDNCFGQFIAGCAWQIEGANNSRIDIVTFQCGTEDGIYAQNYTANAQKDNSFNDVILQGTTERDYHGINLEGAALVREGSSLKLHGGPNVRRALRIHRCSSFALRVFTSFQWTQEGFIHISDAGGRTGEKMMIEGETQSKNSRGTLEFDTMYNVQWMGTGSAAWCVVDLQVASSFLVLKGRIDRQARPAEPEADYRHFRVVGPGNYGVTLNLDGLHFAGNVEPKHRLLDERDSRTRSRNAAQSPWSQRSVPPPVLGEADSADGVFDLRGVGFVDIVPGTAMAARSFVMEPGQSCTLCAPEGKLRIRNTQVVWLARKEDFVMRRGATLTLYCAAPNRIVEVSRSER